MSKLPTLILYNFNHNPIFNKDKVIELYSQKDGVRISYVCTTELEYDNVLIDIFYRATPHPEFKNHYFGLFKDQTTRITKEQRILIRSADNVENYKFDMIKSNNVWHYSQCRHDCRMTNNGGIDGGRRYTRIIASGAEFPPMKNFVVRDGIFVEQQNLEKFGDTC